MERLISLCGTNYAKKKPQICWDSEPHHRAARRLHNGFQFTAGAIDKLLEICDNPYFINRVTDITQQYLCRATPEIPTNPREQYNFSKKLMDPSLADMRRTLEAVKNTDHKIQMLSSFSRIHPIFNALVKAGRESLDKTLFSKIRELARYKNQLDTTPKDHPAFEALNQEWNNRYQAPFEQINNEILPALIDVTLCHLKEVYMPKQMNDASDKKWLAWKLAQVLYEFNLKPSTTKEGCWCRLLGIVLIELHPDKKEISAHNYVDVAMLTFWGTF